MANAADTNADAPMIRTILMERDADTKAQCVLDIKEFDTPARNQFASWTAMARDADPARRALLLDLSRQIDQLVAGQVDEITIVLNR